MMRLLIWLLVIFWSVALLRRAVTWMLRRFVNSLARQTPPANQQSMVSSRRLVRDPVCGVHIAEDRAIPMHIGTQVVHFCSVACRDRYTRSDQKFAAHG